MFLGGRRAAGFASTNRDTPGSSWKQSKARHSKMGTGGALRAVQRCRARGKKMRAPCGAGAGQCREVRVARKEGPGRPGKEAAGPGGTHRQSRSRVPDCAGPVLQVVAEPPLAVKGEAPAGEAGRGGARGVQSPAGGAARRPARACAVKRPCGCPPRPAPGRPAPKSGSRLRNTSPPDAPPPNPTRACAVRTS